MRPLSRRAGTTRSISAANKARSSPVAGNADTRPRAKRCAFLVHTPGSPGSCIGAGECLCSAVSDRVRLTPEAARSTRRDVGASARVCRRSTYFKVTRPDAGGTRNTIAAVRVQIRRCASTSCLIGAGAVSRSGAPSMVMNNRAIKNRPDTSSSAPDRWHHACQAACDPRRTRLIVSFGTMLVSSSANARCTRGVLVPAIGEPTRSLFPA